MSNMIADAVVGLSGKDKECKAGEVRKYRMGRCVFVRGVKDGEQVIEYLHDGYIVAYVYLDKDGGFARAVAVCCPCPPGVNVDNHVARCNAVLALGGMVAQRERKGSRKFAVLSSGHFLAQYTPGRDTLCLDFGERSARAWGGRI